jgi:hypothetical protein
VITRLPVDIRVWDGPQGWVYSVWRTDQPGDPALFIDHDNYRVCVNNKERIPDAAKMMKGTVQLWNQRRSDAPPNLIGADGHCIHGVPMNIGCAICGRVTPNQPASGVTVCGAIFVKHPDVYGPNARRYMCTKPPDHEIPHEGPAIPPKHEPTQHVFSSGAKRSERKLHYHSIHHTFITRVAARHTHGDEVYGEYNWRKGLPWQDTFNHIIDHLYHWKAEIEAGRVPTDDDLAGAALGIEFLMFGEQQYAQDMNKRKVPGASTPNALSAPIDR